jgi:phosphatidylglycerophosphatase A
LKNVVAKVIGTVAGAGYAPVAPGTVGTAVAALVYWFLLPDAFWVVGLALGTAAAGVWAGGVCERSFGTKDPGRVCVDEFAGYLVSVAFLPKAWVWAAAAFFLFRLLDVVKPFPARRSQRLAGGWGIMADDLIVAVYANLILQGCRAVAHGLGWRPLFLP